MRKIIIIDDDAINNFIVEANIKLLLPGVDLICFTDPAEAYSQVLVADASTIVLLDLNMPIMDGWQFLEKFGDKKLHCDVFIVSSSLNPADVEIENKHPNVKGFFSKPISGKTIELIINS